MIIVRSPLRITLGGGGTDIPSYYREHGGFTVSAAIDKYVYVSATKPFDPGIFLKYSKIEHVQSIDAVQHSRFREVLKFFKESHIELTSLADIPAGTGLGSSSSLTVAALAAVGVYGRLHMAVSALADYACYIELDQLKEPIGKQDQYIAAYGGVQAITYWPLSTSDKEISVEPVKVSDALVDNLLLFYTGIRRDASDVLQTPIHSAYLDVALNQGKTAKELLEKGNFDAFGTLLNLQWNLKEQYAPSPSIIREYWAKGLDNGAIGGKLVGAGQGGFLLFYAEDKAQLRKAMAGHGLDEVRFKFDYEGTKVLLT